MLGAERKVMLSAEDRRRTAYHESGHAIVGMLTPGADPVRKVSIIPRGQALGVTFSAPDADRFNFDERHLLAQIKVALGGRVAEEIVFGDLTTGAESDIQQLTRIARHMVGRWGMSRAIGPIAVIPMEGIDPLLPGASETSEATQRLVDEEVRRIVETAHAEVSELLRAHRGNLDSLVAALLERETLDEADAYAAAGLPRDPASPSRTPSRSSPEPALERLATGEPGVRLVPEADLVLVEQPAEVDLLAVPDRGEVDQPAVDVPHDDVDRLQLAQRAAELDERKRDGAARVGAAAVRIERRDRVLGRGADRHQLRARVADPAPPVRPPSRARRWPARACSGDRGARASDTRFRALRSVAEPCDPGERLVALDDSLLDGIVVTAVVHEVPGAVGDLARGLRSRALTQPVHQFQLKALKLIGWIAGREPWKRVTSRLLPHSGRDEQAVSQGDRIHRGHHPKRVTASAYSPRSRSTDQASGGSFCLTVASTANRSPSCSTRESTASVSNVSSSGSARVRQRATSSQLTGVETVGRSRARTE